MPTFFKTPAHFEAWLEKNYARVSELLVGFYKKDSGKPSITYPEALDAALCWGWIDGIRKAVDDVSYTVRFTPRRDKSAWSEVNIKRVGELKKLGRMKAPGLDAFERRNEAPRQQKELDAACEKIFKANTKAWKFFQTQPAGYRGLCCWFVMSAKREETRMKRLQKVIEVSAKGERLAML